MSTTAPHRQPPPPLDLEITIVSAKHLKNVNWRSGDLNPYAIFWLDPDRRLATKSDDSNSTKPVWNERFLIPLTSPPATAVLTLEIFHSKPSDTPKPLVGTLRVPIDDLPDPEDSNRIRTFEIRRPSGRPHGKIRLKLVLRERPVNYQVTPQPAYYYNTAPTPSYGRYSPSPSPYNSSPSLPPPPPAAAPPSPSPPPHPYHYGTYSDPYSGYYQGGYYSQPPPPPPPRPFMDRQSSYGGGGGGGSGGPSAPVDYAPYEQKHRAGKVGLGSGLAVGAVAGGLGGLSIDEGLRYEEEKTAERVETDLGARDRDAYTHHGVDY